MTHTLPQLFLPLGYILQVSIINPPGLMHFAGQLIQVVAASAHQGDQLLQLRQFQLDHIPIRAVFPPMVTFPASIWRSASLLEHTPASLKNLLILTSTFLPCLTKIAETSQPPLLYDVFIILPFLINRS